MKPSIFPPILGVMMLLIMSSVSFGQCYNRYVAPFVAAPIVVYRVGQDIQVQAAVQQELAQVKAKWEAEWKAKWAAEHRQQPSAQPPAQPQQPTPGVLNLESSVLATKCYSCHSGAKSDGGVDLHNLDDRQFRRLTKMLYRGTEIPKKMESVVGSLNDAQKGELMNFYTEDH